MFGMEHGCLNDLLNYDTLHQNELSRLRKFKHFYNFFSCLLIELFDMCNKLDIYIFIHYIYG